MTVAGLGRGVDDALDLAEDFSLMMHGSDPARADDLLDGVAFQGVAKFPVRVKCALLGWMAVRDAIETHALGAHESAVTHDD
jgi:nitrogen fixation NifU-like protein